MAVDGSALLEAEAGLAKRLRVAESTVAELAQGQHIPQYAVSRPCSSVFGSASSSSSGRAHRLFASLLLAPAAALDPPGAAALAASCGMDSGLRWQLLPGGPTGRRPMQPQPSEAGGGAASGAGTDGRHYAAGAAAPQGAPWMQQYEERLQQQPEDEQLWLSYAARHAVEAARGGGGSEGALTPGAQLGRCMAGNACSRRALGLPSHLPSHPPLHVLTP